MNVEIIYNRGKPTDGLLECQMIESSNELEIESRKIEYYGIINEELFAEVENFIYICDESN